MGLRLVDDDLDVSFDIPLSLEAREAFNVQLQRASDVLAKSTFEARLSQQLCHLIDDDLRPPTSRQVAYALSIAKTLDVALPGEALRYKGSMCAFLERFVPAFKAHTTRGS